MSERTSSTALRERTREQSAPQLRGESWWETFFDMTYARLDLDSISMRQTRAEVDFLIEALDLSRDLRIADIGSGLGRHAMEFARRGFERITGLDNNRIFIEEARARAILENLNPRFVNADARNLQYREEFDAAYIWMNLMGYFDDPEDNLRFLSSAAKSLKPGGRFLIDLANRDWVTCHFSPKGWKQIRREYVLEDRWFDLETSTVHSTWTMFTRTGTYKRKMRLRLYSLHELMSMLESAGLHFQSAWGSLDSEPATTDSYHLKILARKEG